MCTVCGCGESSVEKHEHSHSHNTHSHSHNTPSHAHHSSEATPPTPPQVIHHHYHHNGDVHHHYYPETTSENDIHTPHTSEAHQPTAEHLPVKAENGDLHYGKGEAETHVSGLSQRRLIEIEMDVLDKNNHIAAHNREHFQADKQLVLNLVSSPGSGKTTLLVKTLKQLKNTRPCAVIEGDQQTANDADRIRQVNVPAIQVNTGKGCHLDAQMVHDACHQLSLQQGGVLFIENVGNLVCPASFDLGESHKVAILSVTEGEDKPLKYPDIFAGADLMIINKTDLLPYLDFNIDTCIANAKQVNPAIKTLQLSATTGEGMQQWLNWLEAQ